VADALGEGGIRALEITMTVPGAVKVIAEAAARYGDQVLIGAGTVLDEEQARACIDAGARFIVAPIVDVPTIAVCRRAEVAVLPGALSPTEVVQAWRAGADFVKVFPCSAVGGASYIKALRAPLPHIRLVPTGGVTLGTVAEFFAAGASAVGVGGDLCDVQAIRSGRRETLVAAARAYVSAVEAARAGRSY
jgi:2-dehydro-3-deoxyphosphogluconate aldolase/(4S)-4-hydroxy-2-oxoglutarate aldolase